MYRFNGQGKELKLVGGLFKYNPCIGSIDKLQSKTNRGAVFKYNPCIGSILSKFVGLRVVSIFKYNPCIGSMYFPFGLPSHPQDLNTTHVSVQS